MRKIAVVGNVSLDIVFQVSRLPRDHEKMAADDMVIAGGGAPSNVAHWLARLGHCVDIFSVTGTDPLSELAVSNLVEVGVNTTGIRRVAGLRPSVSVLFTNGNYKSMVGGNRSKDAIALWADLLREQDFSSYDHVHIISELHPFLFANGRRADLIGRSISADLNGSYSPDIVADLDLAFSNHDEIRYRTGSSNVDAMLTRDLAERPHHLLVTHAAEDVVCYRPGNLIRVKPEPITVVDRAGGGDAYCAGYLHAWGAGAEPEAAIGAGLRLAGATLLAFGCRPAGPDIDAAIATLKDQFKV